MGQHRNLKLIVKIGTVALILELLCIVLLNIGFKAGQLNGCTKAVAGMIPVPTAVECYIDENGKLFFRDTENKIKGSIYLDSDIDK